MTDTHTPATAFEVLRDNQRQLDMDGCEVGVSRQALDEVLTELEQLRVIAGPREAFAAAVINFKTQQIQRLQAELDGFKKLWGVTDQSIPVHVDATGTTRESPHCPSCNCLIFGEQTHMKFEHCVPVEQALETPPGPALLITIRGFFGCTCAFYNVAGFAVDGTVCRMHPNGCKHGKPWYEPCMPCRDELWGRR